MNTENAQALIDDIASIRSTESLLLVWSIFSKMFAFANTVNAASHCSTLVTMSQTLKREMPHKTLVADLYEKIEQTIYLDESVAKSVQVKKDVDAEFILMAIGFFNRFFGSLCQEEQATPERIKAHAIKALEIAVTACAGK